MKTAEEIVRALAAHAPCRTKDGWCGFPCCGSADGADPAEDHVPECPYRMAREWVEAAEKLRAERAACDTVCVSCRLSVPLSVAEPAGWKCGECGGRVLPLTWSK